MNNLYCTYLTVYKGNKLPLFYIGYSTVQKVNKGYHGSVSSKKYKSVWLHEIKENPHLFKTKILTTHSNKEEAKNKEEFFQRKMNVIHNPLYTNKAIGKHYDNTGNKHSEETIKKFSIMRKGKSTSKKGKKFPGIGGVKKGNIPWNKGLKMPPASQETIKKQSESLKKTLKEKGIWNKGIKTGPKKHKGLYKWYYDPNTGKRGLFEPSKEPVGWLLGANKKILNRVWYHNPNNLNETAFLEKDTQPNGWLLGRGLTGKRTEGRSL